MREEDRAARARARNRIHARKSRQRKKMLVVNLRQGIEDLQAEIGHLLPWFTSHVNPDFKKWKEDNGVVAVPAAELDDDDAADQREAHDEPSDPADVAAQGSGGDRLQRSRARNKLHARKSRQRKKLLMESLKHESSILSQQVALMKSEIAKKLGSSHPCLAWTPPEREPVCFEPDEFDVDDDVSPETTNFSSTQAVQGSAAKQEQSGPSRGIKRARSSTHDSTTDAQGADALLQLAAAASSARDAEMRNKQQRAAGPPTPSASHGGAMDALLSAAEASGGSAGLSRPRSGSEAPSPRSAIPSSAVQPRQQQTAWHNDAGSGFDSAYTAQSSTNSAPSTSQPQATAPPPSGPPAPPAQSGAGAPRFHLTPRPEGGQTAQVPAGSAGLPAGKYKVVTNMDTLPADMKASIQHAMAQQQQHSAHAVSQAFPGVPQHPPLDAGGQPLHPGAMYMHAQAPSHAPPLAQPQYGNFMQPPSMHDLYMMHGGGAAGYGMHSGMVLQQQQQPQQQQPQQQPAQGAPPHSAPFPGLQHQVQPPQGQYVHSPHIQGMHMGPAMYQPAAQPPMGFAMPPHQMYAPPHMPHATVQQQ